MKILTVLFKKMHLRVLSAKWRSCCLGLNVLILWTIMIYLNSATEKCAHGPYLGTTQHNLRVFTWNCTEMFIVRNGLLLSNLFVWKVFCVGKWEHEGTHLPPKSVIKCMKSINQWSFWRNHQVEGWLWIYVHHVNLRAARRFTCCP